MTLTTQELARKANSQFSEPFQINQEVIRFTRRKADNAFAIYYFDVGERVPTSPTELQTYLDRVIGDKYFEGKQSLQWNTYLFFIRSRRWIKDASNEIREFLESDRAYARKRIVTEEQVDKIFEPEVVASNDALPSASIVTIWEKLLEDAGLSTSILLDVPTKARLDSIEKGAGNIFQLPRVERRQSPSISPAEKVLELRIKAGYRDYPQRKKFKFGEVNLFTGPNAAGKTSLLEALELLYCGRNARHSPTRSGSRPKFEIWAKFRSGREETVTNRTSANIFRDRNLQWYGQDERANSLAISFAKFNFLDTDAAVGLTDSTKEADDDLSKLLVGPNAASIFRNMERLERELALRVREHSREERQFIEQRKVLLDLCRSRADEEKTSDLLGAQLLDMARKLKWLKSAQSPVELAREFVGPLAELISCLNQILELPRAGEKDTYRAIDQSLRDGRSLLRMARSELKALEKAEKETVGTKLKLESNRAAGPEALRAKRILQSGIMEYAEEYRKTEDSSLRNTELLSGIEQDVLIDLLPQYSERPIGALNAEFQRARLRSTRSLQRRTADLVRLNNLRERSVSLIDELRDVARQILSSGANPDICPLCDTLLPPGELQKHLNETATQLSEQSQMSRDQVLDLGIEARRLDQQLRALGQALRFCKLEKISERQPLRAIAKHIADTFRKLAAENERLVEIRRILANFASRKIHEDALGECMNSLKDLGYPLGKPSVEAAERLCERIEQDASELEEAAREISSRFQKLVSSLSSKLGVDVQSSGSAAAQLGERVHQSTLQIKLLEKIARLLERFTWGSTQSLSKLVVEAKSIHEVAVNLQDCLAKEANNKSTIDEATRQIESIDNSLSPLRDKLGNLRAVNRAIGEIIENHSLTGAMDQALDENRGAIEQIFTQIHSPKEFSGLGSKISTLMRISPKVEASLDEISTGQRAALALSIFLAQNAQLSVAPPIMLIDDPIAHVDDLNCLAFLDYLREVVLTGRRQIFFATANDKLASLFQRKFDFLGSEKFCRFDLSRADFDPSPA